MADQMNNLFLINAPAGSGKTTTISNKISTICRNEPQSNILCITYTKRAVEELQRKINYKNVLISTIHSYVHNLINNFFKHSAIIDLYMGHYSEQIKQRILDPTKKESNDKYFEKYKKCDTDVLDEKFIKSNLKSIYYNELQFNNLFYGGLSHDDLLSFSKEIITKFPKIKAKINSKFDYIFIDEYQDASADVLDIFYNATKDTEVKLYLLGDKMQQIYKNYNGSFENILDTFDTRDKLLTNFRSTDKIVNILNNIYNDVKYKQDSKKINSILPKAVFCDNVSSYIDKHKDNTLLLYIVNEKRFNAIGAGNLFVAVSHLEKYKFGNKYGVADVLTTNSADNPDEIFKILFKINEIAKFYSEKKYGLVFQECKRSKMFIKDTFTIQNTADKNKVVSYIIKVLEFFTASNASIKDTFEFFIKNNFIKKDYQNIISMEEYQELLSISILEIKNLCNYLENPKVSTQHGVKGEGHDSVMFIAEDSNTLQMQIYKFFEFWTKVPVNFTDFQKFYYSLQNAVDEQTNKFEIVFATNMKDIKAQQYREKPEIFINAINELYKKFEKNEYFLNIYGHAYETFKTSPNKTNFDSCFKTSTAFSLLNAYKLFYVGCSRAKKELVILINNNYILGDKLILQNKFKNVGFEVITA